MSIMTDITCQAKRPTMSDVALVANVARSTVSKALRNDPRISVSQRRRIQQIAERVGYSPHPMVSALMSQIHSQRRDSDPFYISWLNFWPKGRHDPVAPRMGDLLAGARERARTLGYQIEEYSCDLRFFSSGRLRNILQTRAQWGIIIPSVPDMGRPIPIDITDLSSVTIGCSLRTPSMHRVACDYYQGGCLAFDQTQATGHGAIGLALSRTVNDRTNGLWRAAYLDRQQRLAPANRLEPLILESTSSSAVARWLEQTQPDAVLVAEPEIAELIEQCSPRTEVIWLIRQRPWSKGRGLDYQPELLGAAAVDMLVCQIHRNERGSPRLPHTLLMETRWVDDWQPAAANGFAMADPEARAEAIAL